MNISSNPVLHLIVQSDAMTIMVLIILLLMSIICWTVFLYKFFMQRTIYAHLKQALHHLQEIRTFEELQVVIAHINNTLGGYVLKKNLVHLKNLLELHPEQPHLSAQELTIMQAHVEQTIDDVIEHQESYLPILFSCASVSPLLGLFGTVWGLVHAFVRIAQKQSADIATVAPGIAEALITTLAGLIVAIPALMMYHYLISQIRGNERLLIKIADKFLIMVQLVFGK